MDICQQGLRVTEWVTKVNTSLIQNEPIRKECAKQLQTYNLPTYLEENINSTNKGRDLLFANKPLIVQEQKGCSKVSRCIDELHYVDQHILNKTKTRPKNLAMALTYFKKAYDMVPQCWVINCLKIYKISDDILNFIEKIMKIWRVEMTARGGS